MYSDGVADVEWADPGLQLLLFDLLNNAHTMSRLNERPFRYLSRTKLQMKNPARAEFTVMCRVREGSIRNQFGTARTCPPKPWRRRRPSLPEKRLRLRGFFDRSELVSQRRS